MANWQFKLEFSDLWKGYADDELSLVDMSKGIVERTKALLPEILKREDEIYLEMANELENEVIPMFEALVEEKNEDTEDFDFALYYLYEWADTSLDNNRLGGKKMCWVNTI